MLRCVRYDTIAELRVMVAQATAVLWSITPTGELYTNLSEIGLIDNDAYPALCDVLHYGARRCRVDNVFTWEPLNTPQRTVYFGITTSWGRFQHYQLQRVFAYSRSEMHLVLDSYHADLPYLESLVAAWPQLEGTLAVGEVPF